MITDTPVKADRRRRRETLVVSGNNSASASSTTTKPAGGETAEPDLSLGLAPAATILFPELLNKNHNTPPDDTISRMDENGRLLYFYQSIDTNVTTLTIRKLRHFSAYTIHVKACREGPDDNCSVETSTPARTKKLCK